MCAYLDKVVFHRHSESGRIFYLGELLTQKIFVNVWFDSASDQHKNTLQNVQSMTHQICITRRGVRIGRAQASHAEGQEFDSQSSQTNDL